MSELRNLESVPTDVLVALAKAAPSQANRMVRELLARVRLTKKEWAGVDNSKDSIDYSMKLDKEHLALGIVVAEFVASLPARESLDVAWRSMTASERKALLGVILAPINEDDCQQEQAK